MRQLWEVSFLFVPVNGIHQSCLRSYFPTEALQPSTDLIRSIGSEKKKNLYHSFLSQKNFLHHSVEKLNKT